jgi:hypothetical protein
MKQLMSITILALVIALGLSSCVVRNDDYYNVQPSDSYQYRFSDEFNYDSNHWSFSDNGNRAYVTIANSQLHYDYHPSNNGTNTVAVSTGMPAGTYRFDIQTRFRSNNAMALVWGVSGSDYGYSFFIDDRGYFAVYDEGTATIKPQALIDWTQSGAVREGWNDVELQATKNGNWIGYINGIQVFQIPARTLYGSQVGYMVLANTSGDADFLDVAW